MQVQQNLKLYNQSHTQQYRKRLMRHVLQHSFQQLQLQRLKKLMDNLNNLQQLRRTTEFISQKKYDDKFNSKRLNYKQQIKNDDDVLRKKAQILEENLKQLNYEIGFEVLLRVGAANDRKYYRKELYSRPGEVIAEARENKKLIGESIGKKQSKGRPRSRSVSSQIQYYQKNYHDLQCLHEIDASEYIKTNDQTQETIQQCIQGVRRMTYEQEMMPESCMMITTKRHELEEMEQSEVSSKLSRNEKIAKTSRKYYYRIQTEQLTQKKKVVIDETLENVDDLDDKCYGISDEENQQIMRQMQEQEQEGQQKVEGDGDGETDFPDLEKEEGSVLEEEQSESQSKIVEAHDVEQQSEQKQSQKSQPNNPYSTYSAQDPKVVKPIYKPPRTEIQFFQQRPPQTLQSSQQGKSLIRHQLKSSSILNHLSVLQKKLQALISGRDLGMSSEEDQAEVELRQSSSGIDGRLE